MIKIFLVDDDKFLLDMYSLKFKKSGCEVEVAFSGDEALKKIRGGYVPDILLLDIIMPAMDGIEILKTIRTEKLLPDAIIVMLTNQADDQAKVEALGIDGFIIKAMNIPSEVVSQVLAIYNKKSQYIHGL
jgi:CheY-like chemotaxis protein